MSLGTRLPDSGSALQTIPESHCARGWAGWASPCFGKGQIQKHKVVQEKGKSQDSRGALDSHEAMSLSRGLSLLPTSALGAVCWRLSQATCPKECVLGKKEVWGASWPFTMRHGRTAPGCEGHVQLNTGPHSSSERQTMLPFGHISRDRRSHFNNKSLYAQGSQNVSGNI